MDLPYLSIVVPVYNEEENVRPLYTQIRDTLSSTGISYEIIFIDDGSKDKTFDNIRDVGAENVRVIRFQKNYGKSAALSCGFKSAKGKVIITMDGDLQDDPREIPRFLAELEKYDMVSGWKYHRKDPLTKTLPSRVFNKLTRWITGVNIHDFNCGYKAYHERVARNVNLYGEMHRYIPALAAWKGYSVGEIAVDHRPRMHGKSKYGMTRLIKGLLDLITVKFLISYSRRPLHLFGAIGFLISALGGAACLYLLYLWARGISIGDRPLLMLGTLLIFIGIQFISIGLIGELIVSGRNYDEWLIKE